MSAAAVNRVAAATPERPVPPVSLEQKQPLVQAARSVREHAHAPYSRFAVGAALLDEQGRIHAGCNVENAAYPVSQCAEASALGVLVSAGGRRVWAAAVVGVAAQPVTPCGACRQRLAELGDAAMPLWVADLAAVQARYTLGELLPARFGAGQLAL